MILLLQIVPVAIFADNHTSDGTTNASVFDTPASHANVYIDGIYYNLYDNTKEAAVTDGDIPNTDGNGRKTYVGNITIPSTVKYEGTTYNVTFIQRSAFSRNIELLSVTLPNSITSIGWEAFAECKKLQSITIPKSVTLIEERTLSASVNLKTIIVDKDNKVFDSRNNCNAIIDTETNELIQGCQTTVIPNTVTRIGNEAFFGMAGLTSIDIPNSVTSIGNSAFGQSGLTTLTIPNSVIYLGEYIFAGCIDMKSITLTESLKTIQTWTFQSCVELQSITIPASVESIYWDSFCSCNNLKSMYFNSTTPPVANTDMSDWQKKSLNELFKGVIIHVPVGYKDVYRNSNNEFLKNATIIDDVIIPQNTTGITNVPTSNTSHPSPIFDLFGKQLSAPRKGINIINGKKVIIK
jgi:hypothetical protein